MAGAVVLVAPRPPLANAFVRLASTQRTPVWGLGRLASRVGMRFEVSTLSGPDCPQCQTYNGFNHRQGEKTEKRSSSQETPARAVGSAAALAIDADAATSVARRFGTGG